MEEFLYLEYALTVHVPDLVSFLEAVQIYVSPSFTLLVASTVYEVEPFETTNLTATLSVSVIALKLTVEFSAAEFGEAYVNRTASLAVTFIRQVAAPLEVYAVIVT